MQTAERSCLLCDSTSSRVLLRREFPRFVVCRNCGFVFQNPQPTAEAMNAHYKQGYWEVRSGQPELVPESNWRLNDRALALVEWTRDLIGPGQLAVELGCGNGYLLSALKESHGCDVLGIEPSEMAAQQGRERGLDVVCGNIETVKLARPARLVVLSHVLEHLHEPVETLTKCRDLLEDSGFLWIEVPNILTPHPAKRLSSWLQFEHLWYFSPQSLTALLARSGFRAIRTDGRGYVRILAECAVPVAEKYEGHDYLSVWAAVVGHEFKYWPRRVARRLIGRS